MSDFPASYDLSHGRFCESLKGLSAAQLNFKLHAEALTIGQMALHVAGVEVWFCAQCFGLELNEFQAKLAKAATDGSVNENPFPFADAEITPELISLAMAEGEASARKLFAELDAVMDVEITSALGPQITGYGAAARLAFHSGYHHGQAYLVRTAPGFPA